MQESRKKIIFIAIFLFFSCQIVSLLVRSNWMFEINRGLGFGLIQNNVLAIITSIFFITFLLFYLCHKNKCSLEIAIILTGAFSNLAERLIYGNIADYLKLFSWPTFNLADVLIVIGFIIMTYKKLIR